jgi:PST family polysaccharide transporter
LVLQTHDLGGRVVVGAGFQLLGVLLKTAVTIGSTAVLARLLVPSDFGYVAMATVVTELAALFANFGLSNILIQRGRITRLQLDTVFWASAALGLLLALSTFAASFFASLWFKDAVVGEVLRVLCWSFLLGGLNVVPWIILVRLMRFRTEFWLQMTTLLIRSGAAIACALAGLGLWSLVVGGLVGLLLNLVLGLAVVGYRPRLRFHLPFLAATWRTGGSYFGGGLLFYANMNLDLILIGRTLGAQPLGYYQTARSLTDEVRARIAIPLQHVLFPAFSSVLGERERVQAMLIRSGRMLAAVVMPIGVGIAVMAQEVVPVLYGDAWMPMVPILAMLGLSGAIRASCSMASVVINAHDRVARGFQFQIGSTVLMTLAIAITLPHGLVAVAAAQMAVSLYALVPFGYALRITGLGTGAAWAILGPPALGCAALAAGVEVLRPLVHGLTPHPGLQLVAIALIAGLCYVMILHMTSRQYLREIRNIVLHVGLRR